MPLNISQPTDQVLVAEIPSYIRANRVAINAFVEGNADMVTSELAVAGGTIALVVGTDLSLVNYENVLITGSGPAIITQIRGGTQGQVKSFIFQNNNISFTDGLKANGALYLNQLPALSDFNAQLDDVITLINIDGDGATEYGYWKEIGRQIAVK